MSETVPHTRKYAPAVALTIVAACLLAEGFLRLNNVAENARNAALTEQSELSYIGPLRPVRKPAPGAKMPVFHGGESVLFDSTRRVSFSGREMMPVLVTSSFQNLENGLTYGQPPIAHVLTHAGTEDRQIVRRLPDDILPGNYVLIGWVKSETEKRPSFAIFESLPIQVVSVPQKP